MSFSAIINITIFSSIAIGVLRYLFKDNKVILSLDIRFMLACLLMVLIRALVPIESPITNNIAIYTVYPDIYMFLKKPIVEAFGMDVSIMTGLKLVWLTGSVSVIIWTLGSYWSVQRKIKKYPFVTNPAIINAMTKISIERRKPVSFRLVMSDTAHTPFVFGIMKPYIVMPKMQFSEKEIELILRHETLHYYHKDLVIRLCCEIFKAVYWWNPFAYILSNLIAQMQEINVDFQVMKNLSDLDKLEYSSCLVKLARSREENRLEERWSVAFQKENSSKIHKRISLMLENMEISTKKTCSTIVLACALLLLIVVCPNVFIFEPYGISEEDAVGSVGVRDDSIYYIINENGTFDFYINGNYIATEKEIRDENIRVYDSLEEINLK